MKNPRFTGLLLLLTGVLVLMGNTMDVLPAQAFWAGLLTYPIGGYLLYVGSRDAHQRGPVRAPQAEVKNPAGQAFARLQARSTPNPHAPPSQAPTGEAPEETVSRIAESLRAPARGSTAAPAEPLALHDLEEEQTDFQVESDVSFPVEIQERQSLADQLEKLSKLQQQGIISAEEYAVAKSKLLG